MHKMLIVYYSWSNGNTRRIARALQQRIGGDLAALETVTPYPRDYQTTVDQGQREVEQGFMPALRPLEVRVQDYDVVAVGTPTWWYTMAPAVRSFLTGQDWQGKTVIPFMTNGGWPGHVIRDMQALCPGARVLCPLEVRFDDQGGDRLETDPAAIAQWLDRVQGALA